MTTDQPPHTEGTDPVFAEKPEQTDIDLQDIYPNKDLSNLEQDENNGYNYGDWD